MEIGILGSGRFGTALAFSFGKKYKVYQWIRDKNLYEAIKEKRENITYAPGYKYLDSIIPINDLDEFCALTKNKLVISALPTQVSYDVWKYLKTFSFSPKFFICASKGIDIKYKTFLSELFKGLYPNISYFVLSGPSFAKLILENKPTNLVLAGKEKEVVLELISKLKVEPLHFYGSLDVRGVEVGGALKNIYAISAGICDGLNFGENAKAALITRALKEMRDFAEKFGGKSNTLDGLSGLGDLVLSSYSSLSRNYSLGVLIGKFRRFPEEETIKKYFGKNTIEGIFTLKVVYEMKEKVNLYMPILDSLYRFIYKKEPLEILINKFLFRAPKMEFEE